MRKVLPGLLAVMVSLALVALSVLLGPLERLGPSVQWAVMALLVLWGLLVLLAPQVPWGRQARKAPRAFRE